MRITCPQCGSDRIREANRSETLYPVTAWETDENGNVKPADYGTPITLSDSCEVSVLPYCCADCGTDGMGPDELLVNGTRKPESYAARSTYLRARTDVEPAELHTHQGERVATLVEGPDPEATARMAKLLAAAPELLLLLHRLHVFTQPFIAQAAEHSEPNVMLAVGALDDAATTLREHGVQL